MPTEEEVAAARKALKGQIIQAIRSFRGQTREECMISGMSLAASYLAKQEGHAIITAQLVESVIAEVAEGFGMKVGKIKD